LSSGDPPVYGLGWFVQEFQGTELVWAFGYDSFTHLYVKFVDQGYTLIILTNSTALGDYVCTCDWSVMRSPAVLAFYKLFIRDMGLNDQVDWNADEAAIALQLQAAREAGTLEIARQELYDRYLSYWLSGRTAAAQELIALYTRSFVTAAPPAFTAQSPWSRSGRSATTPMPSSSSPWRRIPPSISMPWENTINTIWVYSARGGLWGYRGRFLRGIDLGDDAGARSSRRGLRDQSAGD